MNSNTKAFWLATITTCALLPGIEHEIQESQISQQDPVIAAGALDGSIAQATRFLRELIELTGQEARAVPVLELQFGEILTKSTVQTVAPNYLLITAFMPQCSRSHHISQVAMGASAQAAEDIEYLWHADEGRHIGIRRIQIAKLPDERSVMDAILTTSDQVAAWFSSKRGSKLVA